MPIRLILFDIDGTLLNSKGLGRAAKTVAMQRIFGTDGDVASFPFGGKTDRHILVETLKSSGITAATIDERMDEYEQVFASEMAGLAGQYQVEALPGALQLVQRLRQVDGLLLGIITGNASTTAPVKLRAGGFDPAWFTLGAYGNESAMRDDLAHLALERARAIDSSIRPEETLVIGDTAMDIACARAIGAVAVAVRTGFETAEALEAARPDAMLDDLTQFDAYFATQMTTL